MRKILLAAAFLIVFAGSAFAQAPVVAKYEYMQVTSIESLVPGGAGRSRMLVTDPNGNTQESQMSNLFSLGGINMGNIKENDKVLVLKMRELSEQGWELTETVNGTNETIFITRYLFRRARR